MHISNPQGQCTIVATDQRGSMKRLIDPQNPAQVTLEELKRIVEAIILKTSILCNQIKFLHISEVANGTHLTDIVL